MKSSFNFILMIFFIFFFIAISSALTVENLYDVLGVNEDATINEIKKVYRKYAQLNHPDRNKEADVSVFTKITAAYSILSDDSKRSDFDKRLKDFREKGIVTDEEGEIIEEDFVSKLQVYHVVIIGSLIFSLIQFYYFHHAYNAAYKDAMESPIYQNKLENYEIKKNELIKKGLIEEANNLLLPVVFVEDRKKPHWRDLYLVQLILLPQTLYNWNIKSQFIKQEALKKAQEIKDWNILSSSQKKEYLTRLEEKIRRREQRREQGGENKDLKKKNGSVVRNSPSNKDANITEKTLNKRKSKKDN